MPDKAKQYPNEFINAILDHMHLKNDAALCRAIGVAPPVVSKIRHMRIAVTAATLIKLHDASGLSIDDLRVMLYQPTGA